MDKSLDFVILWHMHQPDYRDYTSGDFLMPWVYLHAIKDYTDMVYHLEQHPRMKAVVNFVPILLDQIEDYEQQFASGQIRDPLLRLLARENMDNLSVAERELILYSCFLNNHVKMVAPYPAYKRLSDLYRMLEPDGEAALSYLSGQYFSDLLTWYHLAWCGESLRREHDLIIRLMSQEEAYNYEDRKQLFDLLGEAITSIIPRYRALAQNGQIEISATPHYHPLAPLLLDLNSAHDSMPDCPLPQSPRYPGGRERVRFHVESAMHSHHERFGVNPSGMWPAEGAVSTALIEELGEHGCKWAASGEGVLANSLRADGKELPERHSYLYRPYQVGMKAKGISCFFRDDNLSDLIGFEYSRWHGKDAALHFVAQLEEIAKHASAGETPVVSVILDGENAWEYYPYNGYHFLNELYTLLEDHPVIRSTTYQDYLADKDEAGQKVSPGKLPGLVAGSWVYGNFATWIGSPDKNRAWDLLCIAKQSYDLVMAGKRLSEEEREAAEKQLASCESSDWFWWFGDYNPSHAVESFDRLYRHNLMRLYRMLKLQVPAILHNPLSHGSRDSEASGTMRRAT